MKALNDITRTCSLANLNIIADLWGMHLLASRDPEAVMDLEHHMREPIAARTLWERLSADERAVLLAIVRPGARNWCALDVLAERAGLSEERMQAALEKLCARFVVQECGARIQGDEIVGQRPTFYYNYAIPRPTQEAVVEKSIAYVPTEIAMTLYATGRELTGSAPDRTTQSLNDLLAPFRQGDLDQIGRRYHMSPHTYSSRNEVRTIVADNVSQAEAVQYALQQIGPPLDDVYAWLSARGGRATLAELRQRMNWDVPTSVQALRTFEEYAIAFDAFSDGERVVFIPAQTFDNLRRAHARPRAEVGLRERHAPRAIFPADSIALWDLAAFTSLLCQQEVELTRNNTLPKRTAQRIIPLLTNRDALVADDDGGFGYIAQLQFEAIDLGIAQIAVEDERTLLTIGPRFDAWSRQDYRAQTHRLARRWPQSRNWRDRVGAGYRGWMASFINVPSAREALLQALAQCDPGVWYDVPSLVRTIQGDDPFVLRPSQRFNNHGGFKMVEDVRAHWEDTDGPLLCGLLSSTLFDLGIVSLGYDADAVPPSRMKRLPDAFMLTELGAEVLKDKLGLAHVAADRALIVQPNFEVLVLEPHMPSIYALIHFAQPVQFGRASIFKLARETLLRAIGTGQTVQEIEDFLKDHSQRELPQNVVYTLDDWARHYKPVTLGQMVLIEVESEDIADELIGSSQLRKLGLRRIGPCALATPEGAALRTVRGVLERAGYAIKRQGR
jgi:hypothetical protein